MVARLTTALLIFSALHLIMKLPNSINGESQVPCIFFFGDSQSDVGNNNFLVTTSQANYLPYGIDYSTGPTGRFNNGKNIPDFLAEFLGFEQPIPPYATAKGDEILKGVNYASGGAGILDETGRHLGDRISMNGQLLHHGNTTLNIALLLGSTTLASDLLNKCLYNVYIGSNDYIYNYLLPQHYETSTLYSPQNYAPILIQQYHQQLMTLYKYGARKVVVYTLGLIGFLPNFRYNSYINGEPINNVICEFDSRLKSVIDALNADFPDARFILINNLNIQLWDPSLLGIKVLDTPCCVVSKETGLCAVGITSCPNRNEYYFWDNYHPTEIVNRAVARRAYAALFPYDAYPTDIRGLL